MPDLPSSCEFLVIGAGPAGSACAQRLAEGGREVLIVDQHAFPRDKTCGDGLIPDAHQALGELGLLDEVLARARAVSHVSCFGSRGRRIDVPGTLAVLPRRELDHLLLTSAQRAGARLLPPARFESVIEDGGHVVGARLRRDGEIHELRARAVVLATGAAVGPLQSAGLDPRRTPSGIALRGYLRADAASQSPSTLHIVWHKRLAGGYGWVFPAPGGLVNIGAGYTGSYQARRGSLRELFTAFCEVHPPARALVERGQWLGEPKGAPLRCSLGGSAWTRPGLLAAGEAIGSTYAFTGEGIGKALLTGLLAADALLEHADDDLRRAAYEASLRALKPRFDLYQRAEHVNRRPWLADLVIWRAQRSARILQRMSGVLEETQNPGRLLSLRGIGKLLFE